MKHNPIEPNTSISHATLRDEDLLSAFVSFLLEQQSFTINRRLVTTFGIPLRMIEEIDWETFCEENEPKDTSWIINEDLCDLLNEIAPEGYYFGPHPGDGLDFGFWADEDED